MIFTEEDAKKALQDRLYPGKAVKIENHAITKEGKFVFRSSRKGVVEWLYPHIFTVRIWKFLESFRYSQCFEKGYERVKL